MELAVRDAVIEDLPAIVEVYNASIPGAWSTADTRAVTVEERLPWFKQFSPGKRPIWVALDGERIVGWICLTWFYGGRAAYDATAEVSLYVAPAFQRRGLGMFLKQRMIAACPRLGVTTMISMYFDHNAATQRINDALGFERMGYLSEIAVIQGQKRGLIIAGLRIPPA
jgi:L-amino acid N-acyltransferase YncA